MIRLRLSLMILPALAMASCGGSSTASTASNPACMISYQDTEIVLSLGGVSCSQVEQQRAALGELWQSVGISGSGSSAVPDKPVTACVLSKNGQTATISYGNTLGDATQTDLICPGFVSDGWTDQPG
jgi:hypothetical protein